MDVAEAKDLKQAYKKEKDTRIKIRMAAVNMVCNYGDSVQFAANRLMQSHDWVSMWVKRFKEGGIDALRDLPHTGRPRKVKPKVITKIIKEHDWIVTPKILRKDIQKKTKVKYSIGSVRRILHEHSMSIKTAQRVHENKTGLKKTKIWQKRLKRRIPRTEQQGFVTVIQDESIFIHDPATGKKYWSPVGMKIVTEYNGKHRKCAVFGSIATDGRTFFRTYRRFNTKTTVQYLKELQRHFGKVHVVMDQAPQHTAKKVKKLIKSNPNIKVTYMPTATPELSAIEEYWHQAKRIILVSEYYATFEEMIKALSTYLRTHRTSLDVETFLYKKEIVTKNF